MRERGIGRERNGVILNVVGAVLRVWLVKFED
jgi:hypothetical protein